MAALTGGLLAAPLAAGAQQSRKVPRIGLLDYANFWFPLLEKLAELGYVEGQTIIFEYRGSEVRPNASQGSRGISFSAAWTSS